jgi:CheY-like chemotaxis protein
MYTALVVDDSPIDLLMTKSLLEKLGFLTITATNGEDALKMILENSPHFVICDINMPGMGGQELLKSTRHFEHQPVFIMATGQADVENAVTSLQHGAYGYLTKPLKEEPLREALRKATRLHQRELESRNEQEKLIKTYPLAELLEKDEFLHNLAEYANSVDRESGKKSGNLEYSPIRLLYYGTEEGPNLDLENQRMTLALLLEQRLHARPQMVVEVHFLPRGKSRENYADDKDEGRYHLFYDMSSLYRVIDLITSRHTLFFCDAGDARISGFTQLPQPGRSA